MCKNRKNKKSGVEGIEQTREAKRGFLRKLYSNRVVSTCWMQLLLDLVYRWNCTTHDTLAELLGIKRSLGEVV